MIVYMNIAVTKFGAKNLQLEYSGLVRLFAEWLLIALIVRFLFGAAIELQLHVYADCRLGRRHKLPQRSGELI